MTRCSATHSCRVVSLDCCPVRAGRRIRSRRLIRMRCCCNNRIATMTVERCRMDKAVCIDRFAAQFIASHPSFSSVQFLFDSASQLPRPAFFSSHSYSHRSTIPNLTRPTWMPSSAFASCQRDESERVKKRASWSQLTAACCDERVEALWLVTLALLGLVDSTTLCDDRTRRGAPEMRHNNASIQHTGTGSTLANQYN